MTIETLPGPKWIPAFLTALAETGKVGQAIEAAGISPNSAYFQRNNNQRFAAAWQEALTPGAPPPAVTAAEPERAPARNAGWRTAFFEALAETSNVSASAARVNVPLNRIYKLKRSDGAFGAKWLAALHEGYEHLELELLAYLRDPQPKRKMDVAGALRLLAAHRETVERRRAMMDEDDADEQAMLESLDSFLEGMRQRRFANEAILLEAEKRDGAE